MPEVQPEEGRPSESLSLEAARTLAFQVFEKAEKEIQEEREAEARFLALPWQEDR